MVNYARIQHHIDKGLSIAAQKLGAPFSVYRVVPASTGDFPGGWSQVGTSIPLMRRRVSERAIESALEYSGIVWYELVTQVEAYVLGDVFVCTDPPYVPNVSYGAGATIVQQATYEMNAVALAWHSPVAKPVGSRIDRRCRIYRPLIRPDTMTDGTTVWRQTRDRSLPLVLSGGAFSWGQPGGLASFVPIGLSSTARPGRGTEFPPGVPGMTPVPRYYCYLPVLPGYDSSEGDRIEMEDGSRYIVVHPYRQEQGVVGSQLSLERMISQEDQGSLAGSDGGFVLFTDGPDSQPLTSDPQPQG